MGATYDEVLIRLIEERKRLELPQKEMARLVHITQSNYSKVEKGLHRLSYEGVRYLSDAKVDTLYIFTGFRCAGKYIDYFQQYTYAELCCCLGVIYSLAVLKDYRCSNRRWETIAKRVKYVPLILDYKKSSNIFLAIRHATGNQQKAMAEKLGVDIKKFRELEKDRCLPDSEIIWKLYHMFQISPAVILKDRKSIINEISSLLEDNLTTLKNLTQLVQNIDTKNTIYPFHDLKEAYHCAMDKVINLFIVDIILDKNRPGDSSGLKFVENIRKINHYAFVPIIFVTSLEDAKLYTYENLHCYSFIEKPFDAERLKKLVGQCLRFEESGQTTKTLYFRKDGIILAVEREDIVYAESIYHIMHIHTRQGDVLEIPYITLKKLLDDIDCADFIQCSRSTVINKRFIENMDIPNQVVQLKNGYGRVEIGIRFKKELKELE